MSRTRPPIPPRALRRASKTSRLLQASLAELFRRLVGYAAVPVPSPASVTWAHHGDLAQTPQGAAAALLWDGGVMWTLDRCSATCSATATGRAPGAPRAPAPGRPPGKFKRLVGRSLQTSMIVVGPAYPASERGLGLNAWDLSDPRTGPLDIRQDPAAIDLPCDSGPGEPPHALRRRASTRPAPHTTVPRLLNGHPENVLPPTAHRRRAAREAALTQSWTDAQRRPGMARRPAHAFRGRTRRLHPPMAPHPVRHGRSVTSLRGSSTARGLETPWPEHRNRPESARPLAFREFTREPGRRARLR